MAEKDSSAGYHSDENFYFEECNNEDIKVMNQ